jgi:hypothetical protein
MESMFIALKEDTKLELKALEDQMNIIGAVLIPNKPIYRTKRERI